MNEPKDDSDEPPVKRIVFHPTKAGEFSSDDDHEFYTEQTTRMTPNRMAKTDASTKQQQEEEKMESEKPRSQRKDKPEKEKKAKTVQSKSSKGSLSQSPSRGGHRQSSTVATKDRAEKKGRTKDNRIPKPRGRVPRNKIWDDIEGVWRPEASLTVAERPAGEEKKNHNPRPQGHGPKDGKEGVRRPHAPAYSTPANTVSTAKNTKAHLIPKPRGRQPRGHTWDGVEGVWRRDASARSTDAKQTGASGDRKVAAATKPGPRKRSNQNDRAVDIPPKRQATGSNRRVSVPSVKQETSAAFKAMREEIVAIGVKDLWSKDEAVLLGALHKLVKFCEPETHDGEMCRQAVFECGAHMITIKTLERHPESKSLTEMGLELLLNMSISQFPMIENALLAMGAVEVVLGAMIQFPQDADILTLSTGILGNLTNRRDTFNTLMQHAVKVMPLESQLPPNESPEKQTKEKENPIEEPNGVETSDHQQDSLKAKPLEGHLPTNESPENKTKEKENPIEEPNGVETSVHQQDSLPRLPMTRLFAVIRDAQIRHKNSEKLQEAASFFLERCLCVGGTCAVDLLVETATGSLDALLASKKNFGESNTILVSRVNSFFHELARLVTQGPGYLPLRGSGGTA